MDARERPGRGLRRWMLCGLAALLAACGGGGSDGAGEVPTPPGPAVRLAIEPAALLLTGTGERRALTAKGYDANGREVPVAVTWSSSDPALVAVEGDGEARAVAAAGSTRVVAAAGALRAAVPVVVARPAAGAVLLADRQVARIDAVDPEARFGIGYRVRITLQDTPAPALGSIVLGTEALPVGGRVVAVAAGATPPQITVEVLPLGQLFEDLQIRESVALADLEPQIPAVVTEFYDVTVLGNGRYALRQKPDRPIRASAARPRAQHAGRVAPAVDLPEFERGPLTCTAEAGAAEFTVEESAVDVDLSALRLQFEWARGDRKLLLVGTPTFTFSFEPVFSVGLSGEATCKLTAFTLPVRAPAVIGLLVGASVPVGAGFSVEGTVPAGGLGFEASATYSYRLRAGVLCDPACSLPREFERTATQSSFKWVEPAWPEGVVGEAEAQVFGFADLHVGARGLGEAIGGIADRVFGVRVADLEFATIHGGLALEGKLASEDTQVADAELAAGYKLSARFAFATGEDLQEALEALEILVDAVEVAFSTELGSSPRATTLSADRNRFVVGDTVNFGVELAGTDFPLAGYNVEAVRIYRKQAEGDRTTLVLAGEATAVPGQTRFEIAWSATVEGQVVEGSGAAARHHFVAFVRTRLLTTRLELGPPTVTDDGAGWLAGTLTEEQRRLEPGRDDLQRLVWTVRVSTTRADDVTGEEASGTVDYFDRYEFWGTSQVDGRTPCKEATVTLTGRLAITAYDNGGDADPATGHLEAAGSVSGTRIDHEGCARHPGTEPVTPFTISVRSLAGSAPAFLPGVQRDAAGTVTALTWNAIRTDPGLRSQSVTGSLAREP
jgi:hypothetical protein